MQDTTVVYSAMIVGGRWEALCRSISKSGAIHHWRLHEFTGVVWGKCRCDTSRFTTHYMTTTLYLGLYCINCIYFGNTLTNRIVFLEKDTNKTQNHLWRRLLVFWPQTFSFREMPTLSHEKRPEGAHSLTPTPTAKPLQTSIFFCYFWR